MELNDTDKARQAVHNLLSYLLATVDACEVHEQLMGIDPPAEEADAEWWQDNVMRGGAKIVALDYHFLTALRDAAEEWRYQEDRRAQ